MHSLSAPAGPFATGWNDDKDKKSTRKQEDGNEFSAYMIAVYRPHCASVV